MIILFGTLVLILTYSLLLTVPPTSQTELAAKFSHKLAKVVVPTVETLREALRCEQYCCRACMIVVLITVLAGSSARKL